MENTDEYIISNVPPRLIRRYSADDQADVVGVWHRSGLAAYTYLPTWQALTLESAFLVFDNVILRNNVVWVGLDQGRIVAYMALNKSYIDWLYVDPLQWHKGWGTVFIQFAKKLSPEGLECHTHLENTPARALYESQGFVS